MEMVAECGSMAATLLCAAVKLCIPELSSDDRACDINPYILSNIYDFTPFTLLLMMTVIFSTVYTIVVRST